MNKYIFTDSNKNNWIRVSKKAAEKHYYNNKDLIIAACKIRLFNAFNVGYIQVNKSSIKNSFDQLVNAFEFYNCNNEYGYYAAYYINEKDIEK